jgi:hypothetical protein
MCPVGRRSVVKMGTTHQPARPSQLRGGGSVRVDHISHLRLYPTAHLFSGQKAPDAAVAVQEGVDDLELVMSDRQLYEQGYSFS